MTGFIRRVPDLGERVQLVRELHSPEGIFPIGCVLRCIDRHISDIQAAITLESSDGYRVKSFSWQDYKRLLN